MSPKKFCTGWFQVYFNRRKGRHVTKFLSHDTCDSEDAALERYNHYKAMNRFAGPQNSGALYPVEQSHCEYCNKGAKK